MKSGKLALILANNALTDTWYSNEVSASLLTHLRTVVSIRCDNSTDRDYRKD